MIELRLRDRTLVISVRLITLSERLTHELLNDHQHLSKEPDCCANHCYVVQMNHAKQNAK